MSRRIVKELLGILVRYVLIYHGVHHQIQKIKFAFISLCTLINWGYRMNGRHSIGNRFSIALIFIGLNKLDSLAHSVALIILILYSINSVSLTRLRCHILRGREKVPPWIHSDRRVDQFLSVWVLAAFLCLRRPLRKPKIPRFIIICLIDDILVNVEVCRAVCETSLAPHFMVTMINVVKHNMLLIIAFVVWCHNLRILLRHDRICLFVLDYLFRFGNVLAFFLWHLTRLIHRIPIVHINLKGILVKVPERCRECAQLVISLLLFYLFAGIFCAKFFILFMYTLLQFFVVP